MKIQEKIYRRIDANKGEMIKTLQELISIPSVVTEAEEDMPFGKNVHEAFSYMIKKAEQEGFTVFNADNYGGHIEFGGSVSDDAVKEGSSITGGCMGIVGHLDVVPEGGDWSYDPYGGEIADGKLYGRGAIDDKGPVISAFYAMKAIKEAGIMPRKKVRLILGLDEETEWNGMRYYLKHTDAPDLGFTPDSEFPAIHGEMGLIFFDIAKKLNPSHDSGLELRSLKGGNAPNMVADHASAVVFDPDPHCYEIIRSKAGKFCEEKNVKISCKKLGKSLEITVKGKSAHGSRPATGVNAISIMMDFLGRLDLVSDDISDFIQFYNKHIGYELDGSSLGVGLEDEPSGKLIFNVGKVDLGRRAVKLTVNIRYPVTFHVDEVYGAMMPVLDRYELGVVKGKYEAPKYLPADDPFIVTLMDIYREHTGDTDSKPMVIGGGTYARMFDNCVAFGSSFPGDREIAHQKNEFIRTDDLMQITRIYADTIYRLTK